MHTSRSVQIAAAAIAVACVAAGVAAYGQDSKSAATARELARVLDGAKLDSVAAADPSEPGTFVAVLYIQGTQMLVVSAKYAAPSLLVDKIGKKDFRDVYIDLNSASVAGSKIFVMDQLADGLSPKPESDQPADTWEQGASQLVFDGDFKKAKLSEADYQKAFSDADARYAHILTLLLAQAKGKAGT
jgi:hypothetical protein